MILSLAGEMPRTVQATGACYLHDVIADVTTTHLEFANGINAHVFVSWLHPFKEQKLVCVGIGAGGKSTGRDSTWKGLPGGRGASPHQPKAEARITARQTGAARKTRQRQPG